MPFIESFDEFKKRQGCEFIRGERGTFFENGARALDNLPMEDPPDSTFDLIANRIAFYHTKREELIRVYNSTRDNAVIQAEYYSNGWGPPPPPDMPEWLRKRAEEIIRISTVIDGLVSEMPDRDGQRARQHDIQRAKVEQCAAGQRQLDEFKKLPIFSFEDAPAFR